MSSKVEKKAGNTTVCKCSTKLTCRWKEYAAYTGDDGVDHPAKKVEQWQNEDGSAHYKWKSQGVYDCVIPEGVENNEEDKVRW